MAIAIITLLRDFVSTTLCCWVEFELCVVEANVGLLEKSLRQVN